MPDAFYIPSKTSDLVHTDGTALNTLLDDARAHYAPSLNNWFRGGVSGKKVIFWGDSTTSNAVSAFIGPLSAYTATGGALAGVVIPNVNGAANDGAPPFGYGNNGVSLATALAAGSANAYGDAVQYGVRSVIAAAPDLVVLSWGINDVRLGTTTQAQLVALLKQAVTTLHASLPNCDIALKVPFALLSDDTGATGFVTASTAGEHGVIGVDVPNGGTQLSANAQHFTDLLWKAYQQVANAYPYCVLYDCQARISGRTCRTLATNPYMTDILHPNLAGQQAWANDIVTGLIGYNNAPFASLQAVQARSLSYAQDYTYYPQALLDTGYYTQVATGTYQNSGSTYVLFTWPGTRAGEITPGDVISINNGQYVFPVTFGSTSFASGANTQINLGSSATNPASGLTTGINTLTVYRHLYQGDLNAQPYWQAAVAYPFRHRAYVQGGGANFVIVSGYPGDTPAKNWASVGTTSDTLTVEGQAPISLSGASFLASGNNLQINKTAINASAWVGLRAGLFGAHSPDPPSGVTGLDANSRSTAKPGPGNNVVKTAAYTVTAADDVISADATSGAFSLTLPFAFQVGGQTLRITKLDSSANAVTITAANGSDNTLGISGTLTYALSSQYSSVTLTATKNSGGSQWVITASH